MKVHGIQSVEVVINPIDIITSLIGDMYTTHDGKLMSGDGSRYDIEIPNNTEDFEYYQSLEKVKNYLSKRNVIISKRK